MQTTLFKLDPIPERNKTEKKQACKRCIHCIRVPYVYPESATHSAAYYCGEKESSRTKNGKQKLYYIGLRNSCKLFSDQPKKEEVKPEAMVFHSAGFFK